MRGFGGARRATLALWLVTAAVFAAPALGAAPADVRGRWSGVAVTDIGTFPNTLDFKVEDFTTGKVSGDANASTYTLDGTVTGNSATLVSAQKGTGYSSTSKVTISADLTTMTGTFRDTNGRSGTVRFTRDGPPPATPTPTPSPTPQPTAPPTAPPTPLPSAQPGCTFGGIGGIPGPIAAPATDPSVVRIVGTDANPVVSPFAMAIDTGDPRGRLFVASADPRQPISVIGGRPLDPTRIDVETTMAMPGAAGGIAVDPGSGRVYVTDQAGCRLLVLDGRATQPSIIATPNLPGNPGVVAVEPTSGRIVVSFPGDGRLLMLDRSFAVLSTVALPPGSPVLAVDAGRSWVYAGGAAGIIVVDVGAPSPNVLSTAPMGVPAALAVDAAQGRVYAVDAGTGELVGWQAASTGVLTRISSTPFTLPVVTGPGPVSTAYTAAFVPGTKQVLVAAGASGSAALFDTQADGRTTLNRVIPGLAGGVAALADPSTGRVFVAELGPGRVAVLDAGGAAAPSLAYELPGPLEISLAPQDVARSVGIMAFVMVLLGAPTPIFNGTLSANRALIERYVRRRLPRGARRGGGAAAALGHRIVGLSTTWTGLVLYLLLAGLLYAFLDPRFPFQNAPRTLGTTLFAIAFGTAVSQVPGELYVRRRYGARGTVKVALWTLALAAGCVLITRVTGVQPGYVYGIIGGFTFTAALSGDDKGRMAWRGMVILLGAGFTAWILRIPFQPGTGLVGGDVGSVANQVLANVFIGAVESSAIGLIPLQFLSGSTLFGWNRVRWALLWGLGLLLFAHVILYPVSSLVPTPSATGLWTVLLTVCVYGGIALGFWWYFHRRSVRHARRIRAAGIAATEHGHESSGDPGDPGAAGDGSGGAGAA